MYNGVYQFTLAKVVPSIEHSGWTQHGAQPAYNLAQLYQAARPGDHSKRHAAALLLEHGHQRRVAHSCCRQAIDCHDHVATPRVTQRHKSVWIINRTWQLGVTCHSYRSILWNMTGRQAIRCLKMQLKDEAGKNVNNFHELKRADEAIVDHKFIKQFW